MSESTDNNTPLISIVIPVKNGISTIESCLDGIQKQTLFKQCEIIVIDSGSADGTLELVKNYPVRLVEIPPKAFNHGATRNFGVSLAKGEFVVMTVQDATPADEFWLENMIRHFKDKEVAGVCGQQIVPHKKEYNPHLWFRPQSKPTIKSVQYTSKHEFLNLSPQDQRNACGWDDVTAMYRKSCIVELPFQPVMFGEDMIWAREALMAGHKLVYDNNVQVEHFHAHNPDFTYRRTLIAWLFIYKTFGFLRPKPYHLKDYLLIIYRNFNWGLPLKWIFHNWSILWYVNKAVSTLQNSINNEETHLLEKKLSINIPMGQSNSTK
ncbi:glycosyltransferase family 2 protein [Saccharicrinis sp. 156]|uniref:glycosyltransferase family 2 protein n=1 Tax=Saccharicrinis sp. 156 TaxID=3417574 RepID=UPI003D3254DB